MCVDDPLNWSVFKTVLYADDTYVSLSHKNLHILQDVVNSELVNAGKWMRLNKLPISYSKSVYMLTRSIVPLN